MRMSRLSNKALTLAIASVACTVSVFAVAQSENPGGQSGSVPPRAARKGFHVMHGVGHIAKDQNPALQNFLNRTLGVTLVSDKGEQISGLLAMNKKGGVLA